MAITAPSNREHQTGLSRHGMGQKRLLLSVTKTSCIFQAPDIARTTQLERYPLLHNRTDSVIQFPLSCCIIYILLSLPLPIVINRQNMTESCDTNILHSCLGSTQGLLRTFLSVTGLLLLGCVHHGLQEHCPSVAVGSYQDHLQRLADRSCHNS